MKKTILTQIFKVFLIFIFSIAGLQPVFGQVQNNGGLYIGDNGILHLDTGTLFLGSAPATSTTTRVGVSHGFLSFGSGATASGASNNHFLDGYAKTFGNTAFVFPVGQSGTYAPARAIPSTTSGVEAAYYAANPSVLGSTLDPVVVALSTVEYWDIKGTNATVSLSWRSSSNLSAIAPTLSDVIIAGYNSTLSKWVEVPASVDATSFVSGVSTLTSGSITSNASVNLSAYTGFTLASKTSLRNDDFNAVNVSAFIRNEVFYSSASLGIVGIEFYDIAGRKIGYHKVSNTVEFTTPFNHAEGVYIVKIALDNGMIVNQKLINRN